MYKLILSVIIVILIILIFLPLVEETKEVGIAILSVVALYTGYSLDKATGGNSLYITNGENYNRILINPKKNIKPFPLPDPDDNFLELREGGSLNILKNEKVVNAFTFALRNTVKGATSIASGTAAIASAGAGGDTIVEIIIISLRALEVILKLSSTLFSIPGVVRTSVYLWELDFVGGIDPLRGKLEILKNKAIESNALKETCYAYETIKGVVIDMFGLILSAIIPDDATVVSWIISEVIRFAVDTTLYNSFEILAGLYNLLVPRMLKDIVENPEKMQSTVENILRFMQQNIITRKDDPIYARLFKHIGINAGITTIGLIGALILPGGLFIAIPAMLGIQLLNIVNTSGLAADQLTELIDALINKKMNLKDELQKKLKEQNMQIPEEADAIFNILNIDLTPVEVTVYLMKRIVPITFGILYILEACKRQTYIQKEGKEPEQIGDINTAMQSENFPAKLRDNIELVEQKTKEYEKSQEELQRQKGVTIEELDEELDKQIGDITD